MDYEGDILVVFKSCLGHQSCIRNQTKHTTKLYYMHGLQLLVNLRIPAVRTLFTKYVPGTYTRAHAHTHPRTRTRTHTQTHARTHTRAHASKHRHAHVRTRTHTHAHTRTRTTTHDHARPRTHARTHTNRVYRDVYALRISMLNYRRVLVSCYCSDCFLKA